MVGSSRDRLLLVFGLRGTLLERIHFKNVGPNMPGGSISVGPSRVWIRPNAVQTLQSLQNDFGCALGIWSSTTRRNTDPMVQAVFPPETGLRFQLVWAREETASDDYRRSVIVDPEDEHATMKNLDRIFSSETPLNEFLAKDDARNWSPKRTVLIDDTSSKGRWNAGNLLIVPSFADEGLHRTEDDLGKMKQFIVDKLLEVEDVRTVLPHRIP